MTLDWTFLSNANDLKGAVYNSFERETFYVSTSFLHSKPRDMLFNTMYHLKGIFIISLELLFVQHCETLEHFGKTKCANIPTNNKHLGIIADLNISFNSILGRTSKFNISPAEKSLQGMGMLKCLNDSFMTSLRWNKNLPRLVSYLSFLNPIR